MATIPTNAKSSSLIEKMKFEFVYFTKIIYILKSKNEIHVNSYELVPGTQASFRRVYEEPIVRGRQPGATAEEKEIGENRASEVDVSVQSHNFIMIKVVII